MKKGYVLLVVPILVAVVLVVFTTTKNNVGKQQTRSVKQEKSIKQARPVKQAKSMEKLECGMLVFMDEECVGWFSPDLNVIGRTDIAKYFTDNQIKPKESEILEHFASLGWTVAGTPKKDKYTTDYQLEKLKTKN